MNSAKAGGGHEGPGRSYCGESDSETARWHRLPSYDPRGTILLAQYGTHYPGRHAPGARRGYPGWDGPLFSMSRYGDWEDPVMRWPHTVPDGPGCIPVTSGVRLLSVQRCRPVRSTHLCFAGHLPVAFQLRRCTRWCSSDNIITEMSHESNLFLSHWSPQYFRTGLFRSLFLFVWHAPRAVYEVAQTSGGYATPSQRRHSAHWPKIQIIHI